MTTCCSERCERRFDCANHCFNKVSTYPSEDYSTFGSGTVTSDIMVNHWCGQFGNYQMFKPIEETEQKIEFPFQFFDKYFSGEMEWEEAIDKTIDELYRLIINYIERNNKIK